MKKLFLLISLFVISLTACKKQTTTDSIVCERCKVIGIYTGTFHDVAGCYGCVPYLDTTYSGNFVVDTIPLDSIKITRSYDSYEWRFAYNDTGKYSRWACCTVGESVEFNWPDSLIYFYNNGGGGGYLRKEFFGKKQ